MDDLLRNYKDELQLLEQQLGTRKNMNINNPQLIQGYEIRIQMITLFLKELQELQQSFKSQENMIWAYQSKVQILNEAHREAITKLQETSTEKIEYLRNENYQLRKELKDNNFLWKYQSKQ